LVNKIANLASRAISFVSKRFAGKLTTLDEAGLALVQKARREKDEIAAHFLARDYAAAIEQVCRIAENANLYFQEKAPWALIKDNPQAAAQVCTTAVNISRILAVYLQPVVPEYAKNIRLMLAEGEAPYLWSAVDTTLENREIKPFTMLVEKVDEQKVKQMIEASIEKEEEKPQPVPALEAVIDITKFMQVDIRAARILEAEAVTDSKKLLKIRVDLGSLGQRTVFAGIKESFPEPAKLVGKTVAFAANLEPRKMKFGLSEGMVLATGKDETHLSLLEIDPSTPPGLRVT
jgi:methionyl-tRNA synthetase